MQPLVSATIFAQNIVHYFRIPSTSTAAMTAAAEGEPEGSVFVAEEQTGGRGRGGHKWDSAPNVGIYFSAILRPHMPPADALLLSLAAGLAVGEAVREVTGITTDLRWPNDVLLGDKKVCGILAEMNAEVTRVRHVVLGIGLNVNQTEFPGELASIATSLRIATGRAWSRVELFTALLKSLDREYRALQQPEAAADIVQRFQAASSVARGCPVQVDEDGGYTGTTEGLDERGFLLVRTERGVRRVLSGTVRKLASK